MVELITLTEAAANAHLRRGFRGRKRGGFFVVLRLSGGAGNGLPPTASRAFYECVFIVQKEATRCVKTGGGASHGTTVSVVPRRCCRLASPPGQPITGASPFQEHTTFSLLFSSNKLVKAVFKY